MRGLRGSAAIAAGRRLGNIPLTMRLVVEVVRGLRGAATIAARRRLVIEVMRGLWGSATIAARRRLVIEVVRGLRMAATIAARRRLGNVPLHRLTMSLKIEMVRGLGVSTAIATSGGVQRSKTASEPVIIPLLHGKGGRRRDKPHYGNDRDKREEKLLHFVAFLLQSRRGEGMKRGKDSSRLCQ
jgi:hypothetical protein